MGYTPPHLEVRRASGVVTIYGGSSSGSVTTDDLFLYANLVDTTPYIKLLGTSSISVRPASVLQIGNSGQDAYLSIGYATPDITLTGIADKNISLVTQGTGVVKFGAYTAGAATDSTGYITILDSAGNTRKLMVQA